MGSSVYIWYGDESEIWGFGGLGKAFVSGSC
jgi:hypothetical protein